MAEQIKIFELNIDVDSAIKAQAELKKETDSLKNLLDRLKKSGDTTSETYVKMSAQSKNLNKEYNASQTQLGKLINLQGKQITTVEQGRNALTILNKEWSKTASLYGANSKQADELAKKHLELKNRVNELQKGVGDTSGNIGNYSKDMQEAIGKTGLFGRAQATVSNILGVAKPTYQYVRTEIKGIRSDYVTANASMKSFSATQKITAITTNLVSTALKLFRVALISTGIGAIIVLIGSLIAWLTKTQAGVDFVSKAMAGLGAFVDVVVDRLSSLASAFGKLLTLDFVGFFNDGKEALSGIGDEMVREIGLAIELEAELQKLERRQIATSVARSEVNKQIKEQNKLAEDTTKTFEERQTAIGKAISLEKNQIKIENDLANAQLKNALQLGGTYDENKGKINEIRKAFIKSQGDNEVFEKTLRNIGISKTLDSDIQVIADAIISNNSKIEASEEKLTTLGNKKNTIDKEQKSNQERLQKERIANSKKVIDLAIKENKTLLKLYQERNKGEKDTLFENIEFAETVKDKKLAILGQEVKAGKKTKTEAELEALQIKNEFLEKQSDLVVEYADEELQIFKDAHQSRIEAGQFLTDALVSQEITRLESIRDKEREFQQQRLDEGVISQKQYNEAIAEVDAEYKQSKEEVELEQKEQKAEADAIDFENEQALRIERDGLVFESKLLELEKIKQAEIEQAEKVGADTTKIEEKYKNQKEKIKQIEKDSKLSIQKEIFGGVAELLGKETVAGKAAGIASATINTYQGVSEVWRAKSTLPEPFGTASKVISTGIVLGSGLSAVKKIASTKSDVPKAEKGITLKGNRHSGGGINLFDGSGNNVLNAEDGENMYVINRRASALINGLSSINELTGGVPLSNSTNFAMAGGMVQRSIQSNQSANPIVFKNEPIDYDLMANKIGQANLLLPRPITDINDVIKVANDVNSVSDGANI